MAQKFILSPNEPLRLLHLCTARVGALLRDQYYYPVGKCTSYANPFTHVPPSTINELFEMVMRAKRMTRASIPNMLRPLLTSGRLTEMAVGFRKLTHQDLTEIFDELASRALHIRKMSLRPLVDEPSFIQAVKDFVPKCVNIERLMIPSLIFEMELLNELPELKFLTIWSLRRQKIKEAIIIVPHYNLTRVNICCLSEPEDMIVALLTYCPNLICLMKCDISEALRTLHGKQLPDETLSKVYGLQEYVVHDTALDIASRMCPMTKVLNLQLTTNVLSQQRSNFRCLKNLESLNCYWDSLHGRIESLHYYPTLDHMLRCMGQGLKHLTVFCDRVDFEALGVCCPNLVSLSVYCQQTFDIHNPQVKCFSKLERMYLSIRAGRQMDREVLFYVLHHCELLRELELFNVECITDNFLDNLLRNNGLETLRKLSLWKCALTVRGIRLLLAKFNRLEEVLIRSVLLSNDEAIFRVIRDFYPSARCPAIFPVPLIDSYPIEKRPSQSLKRALPE